MVFTDLDGTLLEERTYSFEAALPALRRLKQLQHPLVYCTSKTYAECRSLQERMEVEGPVIVENGGGIYLPPDMLSSTLRNESHGWRRIPLGVPYEELRRHLDEVRRNLGLNLLGMGDSGPEFLALHCNLGREQVREAMQREFDEPFLMPSGDAPSIGRMKQAFEVRGLQVSQGGRFFHLSGDSDKGRAVRLLVRLLRSAGIVCETVGIGDSPNDIPMLAAVEHPFLVMRPGGHHDAQVVNALPGVTRVPRVGPEGWNQAILSVLAACGMAEVSGP